MKNALLILVLLPIGLLGLKAQENVDTNYYDPPRKMDRLIFRVGHARWMNGPSEVSVKPWSYHISLHYMQDFPFAKSGFAGAIGLGFKSHNVFHDGVFIEDPDGNDATMIEPYPDGQEPDKNKLSANYFDLPVELRFRTEGSPAFKIAVGGSVSYLFNLHHKIIDADGKRKYFGIDGVNPLRYGLHARIGAGRFNAFASYSLSPFFKDGQGPQMQQVAGGLAITLR
jgi:hypothetical protein